MAIDTDPILLNFATDLIARLNGPLKFRFILQPIMATFFAFRDGRNDFKVGRDPYFWTIATNPEHRKFLIKDGWKGISKVFILAVILDIVYQFIESVPLRIAQSLVIGCLLALLPYVILRGPFNRLTRATKNN